MSSSALGVVGVIVCGQVLFGLLAAAALVAARRRASKRVLVQIAVIIGLVESFILAIGLSAANAARGGAVAVTAGLLWYAGVGWLVVQVAIVAWIAWVWWQSSRR